MSVPTPAPASKATTSTAAPLVQPHADDLRLLFAGAAVIASTALALCVTVIAMVVTS